MLNRDPSLESIPMADEPGVFDEVDTVDEAAAEFAAASTARDDAINDLAASPLEMMVDGQQVKERPIADVILADKYLAAKRAASSPTFGLRFTKLLPPGAV